MNLTETASKLHAELATIHADRSRWAGTQRDLLQRGLITELGAREEMARGDRSNNWKQRAAAVRSAAGKLIEDAAAARLEAKRLLTHPAVKDTSEALLAELQMGRIWTRHQRTLDGLSGTKQVFGALKLLEQATDPLERAVLLQELPAYLHDVAGIQEPDRLIDETLNKALPDLGTLASNESAAARLHAVLINNVSQLEGTLDGYAETSPNLIDPAGIDLGAYDPNPAAAPTDAA